jgi:hypothetical protein
MNHLPVAVEQTCRDLSQSDKGLLQAGWPLRVIPQSHGFHGLSGSFSHQRRRTLTTSSAPVRDASWNLLILTTSLTLRLLFLELIVGPSAGTITYQSLLYADD